MFEALAEEHAGEPPGLEHVEQTAHGAEGGLPNPMHQFEIKRLIPFEWFGFDASFTNSALFMMIAAGGDHTLHPLRHAQPLAGAVAPSVGGRALL